MTVTKGIDAYHSAGDVGQMLGARSRDVTNLIYGEPSLARACPLVGGRRLIPQAIVGAIRTELQRRGKLSSDRNNAS